ncbi:chemotaxis protein histidine kinase CheA [Oceanisphaera litoralis]|uniref:hypothetical protein n=1 Tax=Oceanisphaera litoralis TaxID=225144 RepID=UPI0019592DFC|nr:hypothetical protein [Oceanisphaera litoralis]MBM7455211.1 chemotaxis protein histidine kinase CheA [Oceanisphaera litoralis]
MSEQATTELALPEITTELAPKIFTTGGLSPFIERVAEQVKGEVPDLTTKKGRARIASLAMQVARSKTAVEKPGREYLKQLKAMPKTVETELREFVQAMDALRDEVRAPLNEWEAVEKARVAAHEEKLSNIRGWFDPERDYTSAYLKDEIQQLTATSIADMEEFTEQAALAKEASLKRMNDALPAIEAREAEQVELERLRQEAARREQQEREQRIAIEAAARAKAEAEQAAQAERDAAMQREAELKAQAEQAQREAQAAAELAEQQAINARRQAEQDRIDAEQRAKQQQQQAIEAERQRVAAEQLAQQQAAEQARREAQAKAANVEHRKQVNNAALIGLMAHTDLTEEQAKAVICAVAKGQVSHINISY